MRRRLPDRCRHPVRKALGLSEDGNPKALTREGEDCHILLHFARILVPFGTIFPRDVWARITPTRTIRPPTICTAASSSPSQTQATIAARTGSSMATIVTPRRGNVVERAHEEDEGHHGSSTTM